MLFRAYFADRGELEQRREIVVPDTAHGTNPASVTMAGFELVGVKTDPRGNIDVEDLRGKVGPQTAGLMLTNPSTLGLFDENIEEIERIFHGAGALMYYDGANLNAVCGISRPGDMGFDVVHINLHKTFSQPHGGGGPGGGPIAVAEPRSSRSCPCRRSSAATTGRFGLDFDRPKSIGKVRGFTGPFGVFVRSYAYIRAYGPGLREMSEAAVLNANYLLARLKDALRPAVRPALHARVRPLGADAEEGARRLGARRRQAADGLRLPPADDLLPAGRPGGADDRADRDRAEGAAGRVLRGDARDRARGGDDPEVVHGAPHTRPVGRLDEVKAAKRAVVRYGFEEHPDLADEPAPPRPCRRASSVDRRERERIMGEHQPRGPVRARAARGRAARGRPGRAARSPASRCRGGCGTSRPSVEGYALSVAGPPAYAQRLRQIEDEIATTSSGCAPRWDELRREVRDPDERDAPLARARRPLELPCGQRPDRAAQPLVPGRGAAGDEPADGRLRPRRRRAVPARAARRRLGARAASRRAAASGSRRSLTGVGPTARRLSRTAH